MKQNKVEKLLTGVLSISLAMGVSVMPAFAAQVQGPPYEDMSRVYLTKNYELANEGTFSPAETFSFDIEADNVTDASDDITPENMPMPTIGTVSYLRGEAGSASKTKKIEIKLPEYDSVGVYTYIIHEAAGNSAGVTYYGDAILAAGDGHRAGRQAPNCRCPHRGPGVHRRGQEGRLRQPLLCR